MKTSDIFVENLLNKKPLLAAFYHLTYHKNNHALITKENKVNSLQQLASHLYWNFNPIPPSRTKISI